MLYFINLMYYVDYINVNFINQTKTYIDHDLQSLKFFLC